MSHILLHMEETEVYIPADLEYLNNFFQKRLPEETIRSAAFELEKLGYATAASTDQAGLSNSWLISGKGIAAAHVLKNTELRRRVASHMKRTDCHSFEMLVETCAMIQRESLQRLSMADAKPRLSSSTHSPFPNSSPTAAKSSRPPMRASGPGHKPGHFTSEPPSPARKTPMPPTPPDST